MSDIFKKLARLWQEPLIADLPPELAQCEHGCRVPQCTQGDWIRCENRIRRMREEIRARGAAEDQSGAG